MTDHRRPFLLWSVVFLGLGLGLFAAVRPVGAQTGTPPPRSLYLPLIIGPEGNPCPLTSSNQYTAIPIEGNPRHPSPPPAFSPDWNLAVRGYTPTVGMLGLIALGGDTDDDAPQLASLFRPARVPVFRAVHQVYDWNWACQPGGCLGKPIGWPEVTLVTMATAAREPVYLPARHADILNGSYRALVLYAEEHRITLGYTRVDHPSPGYMVHLEEICVDPNLLALYRQADQAGRHTLPGLPLDSPLGLAQGDQLLVAVRDRGSFMDPRSAKDWWQDTARAWQAAQAAAARDAAPAPAE